MAGWRRQFFLAVLLLSLTGCAFFRRERVVTVILPELPGPMKQRFANIDFLLEFPSPDKKSGGKEYLVARVSPGQDDQTVEIRLPKVPYVPCLAYPVTDFGMLKPAGGVTDAVRPDKASPDFSGREGLDYIALSWEEGFAAEVLLQLFIETDTYRSINVPRLVQEIEDAGGADPWKLDKRPILLGFGYGSFSSYRIKELETFSLEIDFPPGTWFWDNLLKNTFEVPAEGFICLERLALGHHKMIRLDGPDYISLYIGRKEWHAVFPVKGEYKSGSW
jgi:hypothetical protein